MKPVIVMTQTSKVQSNLVNIIHKTIDSNTRTFV